MNHRSAKPYRGQGSRQAALSCFFFSLSPALFLWSKMRWIWIITSSLPSSSEGTFYTDDLAFFFLPERQTFSRCTLHFSSYIKLSSDVFLYTDVSRYLDLIADCLLPYTLITAKSFGTTFCEHEDQVILATDGPMVQDEVGVLARSLDFSFSHRLQNYSPIFDAELTAMILALRTFILESHSFDRRSSSVFAACQGGTLGSFCTSLFALPQFM